MRRFFPHGRIYIVQVVKSCVEHLIIHKGVINDKKTKQRAMMSGLWTRLLSLVTYVLSLPQSCQMFEKYFSPTVCAILIIFILQFIYSEKATKFCEIFTLLLTTVHAVKSKLKISQNFVAFSEYMNFNWNLLKRDHDISNSCFYFLS